MKSSVAVYLLATILPQLFLGPLSDAFGRKKIIIPGVMVALLGSLCCLFAVSIDMILMGRMLQGMGVGAVSGTLRTIPRDLFQGRKMAKMVSTVGLVIGVVPVIAPMLGGYLQHHYNWRAAFVFMSVALLVDLFIVVTLIPETNRNLNKDAYKLNVMLSNYRILAQKTDFVLNMIISGSVFAIFMVYYTITPYYFQHQLGFSALQYSYVCLLIVSAMLVGRVFNIALIDRVGINNMITVGAVVIFLGAVIFYGLQTLHFSSFYAIVLPLALIYFGCGGLLGNLMSRAIIGLKDKLGAAAAMFGAVQLGIAGVFSALAAHIPHGDLRYFAVLLVLIGMIVTVANTAYNYFVGNDVVEALSK